MDTPATPATPIGERIEELLGTLDKTPSWLASTVGVPRSTVHRILKGQRQPTAQTLAEFAMALGMQLEHLVVGTDAAARVSEAANLVSRDLHEQVVSKMIEFESQLVNAQDRTRRAEDEAARERECRIAAQKDLGERERELRTVRREKDAAQRDIQRHLQEVKIYKDHLARATAEIARLRTEVSELGAAIDDSHKTGRIAMILAGAAATASVMSFLRTTDED
ncbi:MAG: helix-turn-helix domain-containing protein [Myxococcales bacterium]|nr:helix-turn-helix domain-containing protein [Myxococcales bacterium]